MATTSACRLEDDRVLSNCATCTVSAPQETCSIYPKHSDLGNWPKSGVTPAKDNRTRNECGCMCACFLFPLTLLVKHQEQHPPPVCKKLSNEVLASLSVCSEAEMICTWSSWCDSQTMIPCFIKIQSGCIFLVLTYSGCQGKEDIKQVCLTDNVYSIETQGTETVQVTLLRRTPASSP